jgi:hypothetical protein
MVFDEILMARDQLMLLEAVESGRGSWSWRSERKPSKEVPECFTTRPKGRWLQAGRQWAVGRRKGQGKGKASCKDKEGRARKIRPTALDLVGRRGAGPRDTGSCTGRPREVMGLRVKGERIRIMG